MILEHIQYPRFSMGGVVVDHHFVTARVHVPLMVTRLRMFHPEIQPIKTTIGHHFITKITRAGRVEGFESAQERVPVPIRYFYGIRFPVHVELNACHGPSMHEMDCNPTVSREMNPDVTACP